MLQALDKASIDKTPNLGVPFSLFTWFLSGLQVLQFVSSEITSFSI